MRNVLLILATITLTSCASSQHGPWVDAADRIANGVNEYPSEFVCDEKGVTFLDFAGHRYAADPLGLLGPLRNDRGQALVYGPSDRPLDSLYASGLTHTFGLPGEVPTVRELYVDLDGNQDYVYISVDGTRLEQWPRADQGCPTNPDLAK
jgi:hypothetical protein